MDFSSPFDRLLAALSDAGRRSRVLGNSCCSIPDPLATTLRALDTDALNALVAITSSIGTPNGGTYRHPVGSLDDPPPPIKRLLLPFAYRQAPGNSTTWAQTAITEQLKSADVDAFAALTSALATEQARRAG